MKTMLFILVSFVAVTTLLAGIILMAVPDGSMLRLPISLLNSTVFSDFRLPGFLLFVFIGGTNTLAVFYLMMNHKLSYSWTLLSGVVTLLWVLIQWLIVDNTLLTDMVYFVIGLSVILISLQSRGKFLI